MPSTAQLAVKAKFALYGIFVFNNETIRVVFHKDTEATRKSPVVAKYGSEAKQITDVLE